MNGPVSLPGLDFPQKFHLWLTMAPNLNALVIGGGPAGCSAAITCAAAGLRVRLLERASAPLDRPGETLHPGVEPLLEQLGAADAVRSAEFLRHSGHWIQW